MQMRNKLIVLFAVMALIASSLACSFGDPALDNVRTAKDEDGNQLTSVFSTTDTVYVLSDLSNGVVGNVVSSKWYAVDVADTEPNLMFDEADINIDEDGFNGNVFFYYPPPVEGAWPTGLYKVEIYFNDVLVSTVEFTVQ
jgi:hypothetical protein